MLRNSVNNNWFVHLTTFWVLIGTLVALFVIQKGELILYFSANRSPFGDVFFTYVTKIGEAFPYAVGFIVLLFVRYKYALILPLLAGFISVDTFILKRLFHHPRPALYFENIGYTDSINFIEGVHLNVGYTSFPSGHTASAFVIFGFFALLSKNRLFQIGCFLMAALIGISRVYLVQHFFQDTIAGAFYGTLMAILIYVYQQRFNDADAWYNQRLKLKS